MEKKRDLTFDIMKGIAILAVFVGHFAIIPTLHLQRFAFSFRMPLLIMIGGIFFKTKDIKTQIIKDAIRLLIPCVFTQFICFILSIFSNDGWNNSFELLKGLYGNAVDPEFSTILQGNIACIGILWFLPAIFWCKTIYNIIRTTIKHGHILITLITLTISLVAIYSCKYLVLPFGISHGLSILIFFHIGFLLKDKLQFKYSILIVSFTLWMLSFLFARFSIGEFYYENLLLNLLGTTGAFYCIYWFSKLISKIHLIYPLIWCGQNSMAIYCFHAICFSTIYIISGQYGEWTPWNPHLVFAIHIVTCLLFTYISSKLALLKNIYKITDFKYEKNSIC